MHVAGAAPVGEVDLDEVVVSPLHDRHPVPVVVLKAGGCNLVWHQHRIRDAVPLAALPLVDIPARNMQLFVIVALCPNNVEGHIRTGIDL